MVVILTATVVIAFIVGVIIIAMYLVRRNKTSEQERSQVKSTQQDTPSGPVYEDISPMRENIELETNFAYGQVRR